MMRRLILRDCGCIEGRTLEFRAGVDIVIEDGTVIDIGPGLAHGEGVDARGLVAVPGLINAHTHLGDAALAGRGLGIAPESLLWPPDGLRHQWMAEVGRDAVVTGMRRAMQSMLAAGTVAFADFREQGADGVTQLREAMAGLPIRGIAFGRFGSFPIQGAPELQTNTAGLTDAQLAEIDVVLDVAEGFSPLWANDATDRALEQIAQRVRARHGRLATHAGETPEYRRISAERTGIGDVERIMRHVRPDFIVHMTAGTPDEFHLLAEHDTPAVMCPRTQAILGNGIPPITLARDAGVTVALGTDNAMLTPPDMLAEMTFYSRAIRAVTGEVSRPSAREMLATTTTAAAETLGLSDTHGQISVGRPATIFLVDMTSPRLQSFNDPIAALVTAAESGDVVATYVDGLPAYESAAITQRGAR